MIDIKNNEWSFWKKFNKFNEYNQKNQKIFFRLLNKK
jgi:hypothetical protein